MAKRTRSRELDNITPKKRRELEEAHNFPALANMATKLRIHSIESTSAAGSGHPTTCSSISEIFSVLFFDPSGMHYFVKDPANLNNDKLVLSKGHAAPILYAAWAEAGLFPVEDLKTLRKLDSLLEGHPTPRLDFVDVATGSLGQGISVACGMAYSIKHLEGKENRVYTILGDGECAEGSVWEALHFASHYELDNLCVIVDVNRLGQSDPTMFEHEIGFYKAKMEAFGLNAINIDGHDLTSIIYALENAREFKGKPSVILARTFKGKDFLGIENELNWHGKPLGDKTEEILTHLRSKLDSSVEEIAPIPPKESDEAKPESVYTIEPPSYPADTAVATRNAYGDALKALGVDERVVSLDGDTKNSTMAIVFQKAFPQRFVECFIAEQNMIGVALGLSCRKRVPFVSAFAAFFSRGFDHIRMCGLSFGNVKFAGSHCGVSIGEDGGSQMGLEDVAMFRTIPGSLVLYPSDAVSAYRAVELAANHNGVAYIRTSRPATKVIYPNDTDFSAGKSVVLKESGEDKVCVIGAGVTLHEALSAYEELQQEGISVRVVDLFSVKPLDVTTLIKCGNDCKNILTVEDHYQEGGIFEAVSAAMATHDFKIHGLYVKEVPRSGKPQELLDMFGISSSRIQAKVKEIIKS